jgi:hypothetical protein
MRSRYPGSRVNVRDFIDDLLGRNVIHGCTDGEPLESSDLPIISLFKRLFKRSIEGAFN